MYRRLSMPLPLPVIALAVLLACAPAAAFGFDFLPNRDGGAVRWNAVAGQEPVVSFYLNEYVLDVATGMDADLNFTPGSYPLVRRLTVSERRDLTKLCTQALKAWDQVPWARIKVRFGGTVSLQGPFDGTLRRNTITLVQHLNLNGMAPYFEDGAGHFSEAHAFLDFARYTGVSRRDFLETMKHELGHALGLAHSLIERDLAQRAGAGVAGTYSAIMSYDDGEADPVHYDDIAGLSSLYPDPARTFATRFVEGALVDAAGKAIYGGNVFVVDAKTRQPLTGRISGYLDAQPGRFRIPLTSAYQEVAVCALPFRAWNNGQGKLVTEDPEMWGWQSFERVFTRALVQGVRLPFAGKVDLGHVIAGSNRTLQPAAAGKASARRIAWTPRAGVTHQYLFVYNRATGKYVDKRTLDGSVASLDLALGAGEHLWLVYAWDGKAWVQATHWQRVP